MNYLIEKSIRFSWRVARNLLCTTPLGKNFLFPSQSLAIRFGSNDINYAIEVFLHHFCQLDAANWQAANKILEIGPGRNIGTPLLMWALNYSRSGAVTVTLWDVFPNMMIVNTDTFRYAAHAIRTSPSFHDIVQILPNDHIDGILDAVERGELVPDIHYCVQDLTELVTLSVANDVDLVYSQAAIEHIWAIEDFWQTIIGMTRLGGWHSHRIDLADHGRRDTNYIEMLEWSPLNYWLSMRFIPGAINRWRACMHLEFLDYHGLKIVNTSREIRECLPIPLSRIDKTFRSMQEVELQTTAIDIVALKTKCV